jgi:membrane-bound toxin of toxin-antitoxin system
LNPRRLRVELAPSAFLTLALVAVHAAAALCVLAVLPEAPGLALAVLLALLGVAAAWSRALHRAPSSVRALELGGPQLEVRLANGECFAAEVAARRYAGRHMVILPLRRPVRRTILVTRDMTDADSFRRLRIWALWGRLPVASKQLPA